jgi:hypothetical protein
MGRVWALALGLVLALFVVRIAGPLGGPTTMLTAAVPVGAGAAAAYLGARGQTIARGLWLLVGVLFGAVGYVLGASLFPDTMNGLFLGAIVPILLGALATMWTRRQTDFLCTVLAAGSLAGVYATRFNTDPQSLNYSLPIAIGQTLFPLALGFIGAIVVQAFVATDAEEAAVAQSEPAEASAAPEPDVETGVAR